MTLEKEGKEKGSKERTKRRDCVVCCNICDRYVEKPNPLSHSRRGRKTVKFCQVCRVYLCDKYFDSFHEHEIPTLPLCVEKKYGLDSHRRLDRGESQSSRSPKKRKSSWKESRSLLLRQRAISVIGEKMKLRAAGESEAVPHKWPKPTMGSPLRSVRKSVKQALPTQMSNDNAKGESNKKKRKTSTDYDESEITSTNEV